MRKVLKKIDRLLSSFFISPLIIFVKLKYLPVFIRNIFLYKGRHNNQKFKIQLRNLWYATPDRGSSSGSINNHYFHQDIWAAKKIYENKITKHVDVGSRLDGFVAHLLPFCKVEYIDIRPLETELSNFKFIKGSILNLPYDDNSVSSLSCLHVIEHIGLGRYGDEVNPDSYIEAAAELKRVLAKSGHLYFSTPVGKEKLYFDAHRIFSPETIVQLFNGLILLEFNLIDDKAKLVKSNASFNESEECEYGCGLFLFTKE